MSTAVHTAPPPESAVEIVESGVQAGDTIVVFARCKVHYYGRATGYLGPVIRWWY